VEIEIDQSIKIEQSQRATALAFSNSQARALLIPARVKQAALRRLRQIGLTGSRATLWLFAAAIYLLVCNHLWQVTRIVIDVEYQGHEDDVRLMLLNFIRRRFSHYPAQRITFRLVGKTSRAHALAFRVQKGREPADQVITLADLEKLWRVE
jgi:hypothetical protein